MRQRVSRGSTRGRTAHILGAAVGALALVAPLGLAASASATTTAKAATSKASTSRAAALPVGPTVSSPDGALSLGFGVTDGHLSYGVARKGASLVSSSALGLALTDGTTLGSDVQITGTSTKSSDTTWKPVWGANSSVRNNFKELTVGLKQADGRVFSVVARAYDDGVAFRYSVPKQASLPSLEIVDEATQFSLTGDPTATWLQRGLAYDADEQKWQTTPYSAMGDSMLPATFVYADGTHLSIHEADLNDYAGGTLVKEDGHLRTSLVPTPNRAAAVVTTTGRDTPWRTLTITKDAAGLIESNLIENLNPACAICDKDTSWIKPTKYVGIWWAMQFGQFTWEEGPRHGATTARAKQYIDFASAHNIHGILVEGWNKGWEGSWADQDYLHAADDFDLAGVVAYGKSKGVEFVVHNETGADPDNYEKQIDAAFDLYQSLGIHYLKTGYVGTPPGHNTYDQRMVNHYRLVLQKAAAHQINVVCHECIHSTGEVRTYPNALAREAMRGQEYDAFSDGNSPYHTLTLPFTRMLSGPMDYTPGIMDILWDPQNMGRRVHTTVAKQLSYYVNYFSGVQMAADLPEHYENQPGLKFIEDVPAKWDESHVLAAGVSDDLVTARRAGNEWYVGAMTGERAQTLNYSLSFLGKGNYVAEAYTDAAATDYDTNPTALSVTSSIVTRKDTFVAALERSGGQAVRFRPATSADLASIKRYVEPELEIVKVDAPAAVEDGDLVTVSATVKNTGSVPGGDDVTMSVKDTTFSSVRNVRVDAGSTGTVQFQARLTGKHSARIIVGNERVSVRINRSADALPAPAGLKVSRFAGSLVALEWQPVAGASYQVFRRTATGIYGAPIATVPAGTTTYADGGVTLGNTYGYVVRAVLGAKVSIASNEVTQLTSPQLVNVTWRVRVPDNTPAGDTVYLPGSLSELGPWDPGKVAMHEVAPHIWEASLPIMEGTFVQYKYTRGTWDKVENWGEIVGITSRFTTITFGTTGDMVVDDTSTDPATPDAHEMVRAWIDVP